MTTAEGRSILGGLEFARHGEALGQATYRVRIDPDKTDPRSLLPLRSSRFTGHEALTGAASRAAAALKGELVWERIGGG